ncbi:MAG: ABC transporter ATP-binding protein [Gordonia sp. (in: high G+C Gram-positive bacteria)]
MTARIRSGDHLSGREALRRGIQVSPELVDGLWITMVAALISTAGRVVVPIAVQRAIDQGVDAASGVDVGAVTRMACLAAVAVVVTGLTSYWTTARLFDRSESGLSTLRIAAFRHVHDLPMLSQATESRGSLVSRVTGDVDQISRFVVYGGVVGIISLGQITVATVIMLVYSPELTLVVWLCFLPLFVSLRYVQRRLASAYAAGRRAIGAMMSAIAESVVGAVTVRSHGVERRVRQRVDETIDEFQAVNIRAQAVSVFAFSLGGLAAGLANACVIVVGVWLGVHGRISAGEVVAFIFLTSLFVSPVQNGTRIITDLQTAVAGWRRVIGVLDTPIGMPDAGSSGTPLPAGPLAVAFRDVGFSYTDGAPAMSEVNVHIAAGTRTAVVGETGSGKSTFAKLMVRLVDPDSGSVALHGVDLREVATGELRSRTALVPQEGYLFDGTLLDNLRFGDSQITSDQVTDAIEALGLSGWLSELRGGLETPVGQRGESLSAGERQLVALVRTYLADPDLLVLDEATSSVDPALEVEIVSALERLLSGRTSVIIAHRLSTAENADEVIVFDAGRVVQRGTHAELIDDGGVYGRLHASWERSASH